MASLAEQPENINYLTNVQFKFELVDYPGVTFFVQGVNLPGLSTQAAQMPFPRQPGIQKNLGVIEFEMLSIQFLVDEYLKNWMEIYKWITGGPAYTSGVLTILSSSMNPTIEAHFKQLFPTSLTALQFDSTTTDPIYHQASVSFKYTEYTIKSLLND